MKATEKAIRAHQGLLSHVVGVGAAAQQPTRQVERGVQVREHGLFKTRVILRIKQSRFLPGCVQLSPWTQLGRTFRWRKWETAAGSSLFPILPGMAKSFFSYEAGIRSLGGIETRVTQSYLAKRGHQS